MFFARHQSSGHSQTKRLPQQAGDVFPAPIRNDQTPSSRKTRIASGWPTTRAKAQAQQGLLLRMCKLSDGPVWATRRGVHTSSTTVPFRPRKVLSCMSINVIVHSSNCTGDCDLLCRRISNPWCLSFLQRTLYRSLELPSWTNDGGRCSTGWLRLCSIPM